MSGIYFLVLNIPPITQTSAHSVGRADENCAYARKFDLHLSVLFWCVMLYVWSSKKEKNIHQSRKLFICNIYLGFKFSVGWIWCVSERGNLFQQRLKIELVSYCSLLFTNFQISSTWSSLILMIGTHMNEFKYLLFFFFRIFIGLNLYVNVP